MGLEGIANTLGSAYQLVVDEVKKDKAYAVTASLYIAARVLDGYTTNLAYHLFEDVGEENTYFDWWVNQFGNPEGLIVGMGITSLVALSLTKILNDGFSWTKHLGTVILGVMTAAAGYAAANNWQLYLENVP